MPTTQLEDHAQTVRHAMVTRSLLQSSQRRQARRSPQATAAIARAKCANANRRAAVGDVDAQLRGLLRLCAQAGLS